jgi:hypothetical protein
VQQHNQHGPHSPGAWVGIAICIIVCIAWILRYSYLASPFWFFRIQRWLRIRPHNHTTISHQPIYVDHSREQYITRPAPAHVKLGSEQVLPHFQLSSRFSSDVLDALAGLELAPGRRPLSWRLRLSSELRQLVERARKTDVEMGRNQGRDDRGQP